MLITGYIDKYLSPYLNEVYLVSKENTLIPIKTVIDTGFNGEFCLPNQYKEKCNLLYSGSEDYILGDGSVIEDETYNVQIIIGNQPLSVTVSFTDDDAALLSNWTNLFYK